MKVIDRSSIQGKIRISSIFPSSHSFIFQNYYYQRCIALTTSVPMKHCPECTSPQPSLYLMPMSFHEMDEAKKIAAEASTSGNRVKKRKVATIARLNRSEERRVGKEC